MTKMSATSQPAFTQCIVFYNPASTHAEASKRRIEEVRQALNCPIEIIETSPDGRLANARLVVAQASKLGPQTLLCIAAGDGSSNQIIEALLTAKGLPEKARATTVLPLWGGNANDLACMLNGAGTRGRVTDILRRGHVVAIHPLECETTIRGKKHTYIAACYASFGATAFAAQRLNADAHRRSPLAGVPGGMWLQEIITVATAFLASPSFAVKDADDVKIVYERTFANGSRMAKIKRLPIQLTDEMFYLNTLENKRLVSVLPRLIEMTRKRMSEKFLRNYASFTLQEESWAQFDGEPIQIPANTKVQVQLSPRPFYALSLDLVPAEQSSK